MKPIVFITQNQKPILWLIIAVLLYILFAKPCSRDNSDKLKALAAENKALTEKVKRDSAYRVGERKGEQVERDEAERKTAAAVAEKILADRKLSETQGTVRRLVHDLAIYRNEPIDSLSTKVNKKFVESCDSLALVAVEQSQQIDLYRKETDEAMELMNYEILLRDSALEKEVGYSDSLRADFNRQSTLLKSALQAGRPKGKLLAGAGVIGNEKTFLAGGKVMLAYQSKGGKQYQAEAMIVRGEVYYGAGVMVQLFR